MSSTAAAVVTQQVTTGRSQAGDATLPDAKLSGVELSVAALFDEFYKGRRIFGAPVRPSTGRLATSDADSTLAPHTPQVLIDGAALHIMTNADGTYTSVVNHYQSFRSLHEVARAAVDDLGDATLVQLHHHG